MTADLAKFEQELLRRNAALEERAAASIARAKAVVEGQSHAHPPDAARATKTLAATHSPSRARRSAEAFLREAAAYYDEEEENTPPTPDQASFDDDDEHESVEDDLDATRGPAFEPPRGARPGGSSRASSARQSRDIPTSARASLEADRAASAPAPGPEEDNYGRLAKARIRALQDELAAQARELRDVHTRLKDRDGELKTLLTEKLAAAKAAKAAQSAVEKERRAAADAAAKADATARELAEARRDADRVSRANKAAEQEQKAREVRLNRALEEVERYRHMAAEARDAGKGGNAEMRKENAALKGDVRRLERQKAELVAAFKKQMKLVDVLKKQKIHLEAARTLQFAEEEFMRTLEDDEGGRHA